MRRVAGGGVAALAVAAVLLFGGALDDPAPTSPSARAAAPVRGAVLADPAVPGFASGSTAAVASRLEQRVRDRPGDARALVLLGAAYQQLWRETADASYLTRAEAAFRRTLELDPRDPDATSGLAGVALSRHDFRRAYALGRRARALAPHTARHYGVIGDALAELGRYEEAFRAYDRMVSLRPDLGSYARVAFGRELLGRPRAAIEAMELALSAAGGLAEPAAWVHVELGKLHLGLGQLTPAGFHFRAAHAVFPGYVFALDGLARVEAARGRHERAVALARRAVEAVPLPQFAATLGDLYLVTGRRREAEAQYAVVGAIERLLRANGVRTDLETAVFDVDHGFRLRSALVRARSAHRAQPSIAADDVLAWALARNGRCGEALRYSRRALRLGTRDAAMFFHRGMIERCLGHEAAARRWFRRALATNPHFSIVWAPVAKRYAS